VFVRRKESCSPHEKTLHGLQRERKVCDLSSSITKKRLARSILQTSRNLSVWLNKPPARYVRQQAEQSRLDTSHKLL
jgi:hypothetical protein